MGGIFSFLFYTGIHVSEDHDLASWAVVFPSAEDQDVRTDGGCGVAVSTQGWLALESSFLPNELVLGVEDNEVVNICWGDKVLFPSRPGVVAPASEEYDVRT